MRKTKDLEGWPFEPVVPLGGGEPSELVISALIGVGMISQFQKEIKKEKRKKDFCGLITV